MNLTRAAAAAPLLIALIIPAAHASAEPAPVGHTIRAHGKGLVGRVTSPEPGCVAGRQVRIYTQTGTRGGGDDQLFDAQDITVLRPGLGSWEMGQYGPPGRYYAVLAKTADCRRAATRTVRIVAS